MNPNQTLVKAEESWYSQLIEDCKSIMVEGFFTSRWAVVECYHELGKRILSEHDNFERVKVYGKEIVTRVSKSLGKSEQSIYRAMRFAKKFPRLSDLKEGKDITWHKICHKYLPDSKNKIDIPLPEGKYGLIVVDPPWP